MQYTEEKYTVLRWHRLNIPAASNGHNITAMDWHNYRFMIRENDHDLHPYGILFQQYIVDMYAKVEQNRLNYLQMNQKKIAHWSIPWSNGCNWTGRQRYGCCQTPCHPAIIVYWEPAPHVPTVPGRNEYCAPFRKTWPLCYSHVQSKLERHRGWATFFASCNWLTRSLCSRLQHETESPNERVDKGCHLGESGRICSYSGASEAGLTTCAHSIGLGTWGQACWTARL